MTLLVTLNSKFTHTSLALRCLKTAYPHGTEILECTVNQPKDEILRRLVASKARIFAFSVYIFNVEMTRNILADLRILRPDALILCGGPEVSYNGAEFLEQNPAADGLLLGEGEETFREVMTLLEGAADPKTTFFTLTCPGIAYRKQNEYCQAPARPPIADLDALPFPYEEGELEGLRRRILYYESSRGCPYTCIYCLSSVQGKVRFRSVERVKEDLKRFLDARVRLVKFVDRTFNCNKARTLEILRFLKENDNGITSFHFEVAAWLLSEEELELLESFRPGMILLEAGIQSANPETLVAITRKTDPEKLYATVARLAQGPCHVHTDLIAGLPYEDLKSFEASFNKVFGLKSHCLQLGFLKKLHGTALEGREDGAEYSPNPPYEILKNPRLSPADLQVLKGVEKTLDAYWNTGFCRALLSYLTERYTPGMFSFFSQMADFLEKNGEYYNALSPQKAFGLMAEFLEESLTGEVLEISRSLLCLDFYRLDRCHTLAPWMKVLPDREGLVRLLKTRADEVLSRLTPEQRKIFGEMSVQQWFRNAELVPFPCTPEGKPSPQLRLFLYGNLWVDFPVCGME